MDLVYSGEHSINFYDVKANTITEKNTWKDFHLIPSERPSIAIPSPNLRMIAIPGTNKRVDVTDYHVGGLTFGSRTGSWEFYIDHDQYSSWVNAYDSIVKFLHGKELYVALADDPMIYYKGVMSVSSYISGSNYSKITIQYDLDYDITVGLSMNYPIKFVGKDGILFANNYSVKEDTDYITKLSNGKISLLLYDLEVLTSD